MLRKDLFLVSYWETDLQLHYGEASFACEIQFYLVILVSFMLSIIIL